MTTRLDLFKKRMEPSKELYTREILNFTQKYDALGEMTLVEEPDIDTQDYIFVFEVLNGKSKNELDEILLEICDHMDDFSKANSIESFNQNTVIWL